MTKELHCCDFIEGCDHVIRGETEDEVLYHRALHVREAHDTEENDEVIAKTVRRAIRDV